MEDLLRQAGGLGGSPLQGGQMGNSRAEKLSLVCEQTRMRYQAGQDVVDVVETLANAARDASWRLPIGQSGLLDFFLSLYSTQGPNLQLRIQTLRLAGNSCADVDANRTIALPYLGSLASSLGDSDLLPYTLPVLHNILVDFDTGQKQASASQLSLALTTLLGTLQLPGQHSHLSLAAKILNLLSTQETEDAHAPATLPSLLLSFASSPEILSDAEGFTTLLSTALNYLTHPNLQLSFTTTQDLAPLLSAFSALCLSFDPSTVPDQDLSAQIKQLRPSLMRLLSDLSYHDVFSQRCPPGSPTFDTLLSWLSTPQVHLQSSACLMLGNISRSDQVSSLLASTHNLHLTLVSILSDPSTTDSQLLHSVLSCLKNLAIPPDNKTLLGDASLLDPALLPRIWSTHPVPEVQFAAVSLARLLLVGCAPNVRRICTPLEPDPSLPPGPTRIQLLIDVFVRTDAEPIKMESARAISAACRVLHSHHILPLLPDYKPDDPEAPVVYTPGGPPLPPDVVSSETSSPESPRRARFYRGHHLIRQPLAFLVAQSKFPLLRSETWFVFAMMAKSTDGASLVMQILDDEGAFGALVAAITGRSVAAGQVQEIDDTNTQADAQAAANDLGLEAQQVDPQQKENMANIDRENGLVLLAELTRVMGQNMPPGRRQAFADLTKEGTAMVAAARSS